MEKILELLKPKTFNTVHYAILALWFLISTIPIGIFVDMEIGESRYDFRCGGAKSENVDVVRGKCYEKYMKQYNRLGFPVIGFVIINAFFVALPCAIYSFKMGPKVDQLSRGIRNVDQARHSRSQETASSTGKKLFKAYCCQLSIRFGLGVIFIILQTRWLYPLKFSPGFNCSLTDGTTQPKTSSNNAQNSTKHDCHNQRAEKKTFWMYFVLAMNVFLVAFILVETVYLLLRAYIQRSFMQDSKFLKTHLSQHLDRGNETIPLTNELQESTRGSPIQHFHIRNEIILPTKRNTEQLQEQTFQEFIAHTKEIIIQETQGLLELQSPFLGGPGDDTTAKNLTLDQIYTNLMVIQNTETYDFPEDRRAQLVVYPWSREKNSQPNILEDLLNVENKKFLIVGRPGIGKTLWCIKLLKDWALEEDFKATSATNINFYVAFLVKFRRFNSTDYLSLRELLIQSEYFPAHDMDDKVWNHLQKNPEGVLILFDGFDEFKHDGDIAEAPTYPRSIEDKKPLQILYEWLVTGKLLKGASVLTTTRSTALSSLRHLSFDKRYEILGFSLEQVKEYVYKFAGGEKEAGDKLWQHISSNMNLLSLCYVPVNSFIMCTSLSQIMKFNSTAGVNLPSKLTEIFKIAVKVFYVKRAKDFRDKRFTRQDFESDDLLDDLAVKEKFEKLGRIAFDGLKKGELILGGNEVRGMEDNALFHRLPDRQTDRFQHEPQFCFIHLTMQEFFAAMHLVNMNEKELRKFVSKNIKNGKWQLVFQFLAGLMEDKTHLKSKIITDFLPVKTFKTERDEQWTQNEDKRKVTYWPAADKEELALTLIKCFNENSRMKEEAQRKLKKIKFSFVNFYACDLTAADCSSLLDVINVQQIAHLDFGFNELGPSGGFEICKLLKCKNSQLSWLDLTSNQLADEGAEYLAEALNNNCQLRTLIIADNGISDIGAQRLAEAINNCQLHTLILAANDILGIGAEYLAKAIKNNCQLHTLGLAHSKISDIGARHLAEAIKSNNCQLRDLIISGNKISDDGAQYLADAIKNNHNCQLSSLNLETNDISDNGAQCLAEAITNCKCQLRTLNLRSNHIKDDGARHLAEAITNCECQLRTLNLEANCITDIAAQHLVAANNNNNSRQYTLELSLNYQRMARTR